MSTPERIELLWAQLSRNPCNRYWEEAYARFVRWIDALGDEAGAVVWSDALAPIAASFSPGFVHPANPIFDAGVLPCVGCGAPVWRGEPLVLGEPQSARCRIGPQYIRLNVEPNARGRWLVTDPDFATFAPGVDMVRWPLPRYTSHMLTCPYLIARRKEEQEYVAQKMRDAAAKRTRNRAEREARIQETIGA